MASATAVMTLLMLWGTLMDSQRNPRAVKELPPPAPASHWVNCRGGRALHYCPAGYNSSKFAHRITRFEQKETLAARLKRLERRFVGFLDGSWGFYDGS